VIARGLPAVARSAKAGLLAAAVLAALAALFAFKAAAKMPDFEVYWRAGVRARAAEPLYRDEDVHFRLKYLPAFAVLSIPAGLLPLTASARFVYVINYDGDLPPPLRATTWLALALIAFSLYDIVGREAYGRFMELSIISVCFLVVVAALTALRWRCAA